jgi:hypothetical protein
VADECSEVATDVLPLKIYGSEAMARGGGELHVDATGHFTKRFRDVLYRIGEDSAFAPEFDRVALEVAEDSWLHLVFSYSEYGSNTIKVVLTDTVMLGQEMPAESSYQIGGIAGEEIEQVF